MAALYGAKFADMWRGSDAEAVKAVWADEMGKLTNQELKRGVDALMSQEWPPSLPQFIKLCRPPIDPLTAYYEAVAGVQARERGEMGEWSSPAIFWASVKVGAFDLKNQAYAAIKGRWETALQDVVNAGGYQPIPEPVIALPAPEKTAQNRKEAAQVMQKIGAAEVLKPKRNYREWATNLLAEEKRNPGRYPGISVRFAREALSAGEA